MSITIVTVKQEGIVNIPRDAAIVTIHFIGIDGMFNKDYRIQTTIENVNYDDSPIMATSIIAKEQDYCEVALSGYTENDGYKLHWEATNMIKE